MASLPVTPLQYVVDQAAKDLAQKAFELSARTLAQNIVLLRSAWYGASIEGRDELREMITIAANDVKLPAWVTFDMMAILLEDHQP